MVTPYEYYDGGINSLKFVITKLFSFIDAASVILLSVSPYIE